MFLVVVVVVLTPLSSYKRRGSLPVLTRESLGFLFFFLLIFAKSHLLLFMGAAITFLFGVMLKNVSSLMNTRLNTLPIVSSCSVSFHTHFLQRTSLLSFLAFLCKLGRKRFIFSPLMRCAILFLNVILLVAQLWVLDVS